MAQENQERVLTGYEVEREGQTVEVEILYPKKGKKDEEK